MKYFLVLSVTLLTLQLNAGMYTFAGSDALHAEKVLTINSLSTLKDVQNPWNPLPPVDFSTISSHAIRDELMDRPAGQGVEYDIHYYIGHFHQMANAVETTGTNKGFIDLHVWRNPVDNKPYNARIMENITTLAWFYTQEETWNPYYNHPDLKKILEAALTFWVNMQNSDGRFSEYGVNQWNLAATAFATKFMGKTLEMLQDRPAIDPVIHEKAKQANRKALMATFTSESLYNNGKRFSNQYGNAFTGALAHLAMNPDDNELRAAFESRLKTSLNDFQSPAGYFYENYGPDWSYAFGTHHSNILMAWHYARHNETLAAHYANEHRLYTEWLSYNAVLQPDGEFFMLHRSIETRQSRAILNRLETPLSEVVPLARAFNTTSQEAQQRLAAVRQQVTNNWGKISSLHVGNFSGYSAYSFLHRDHYRWNPDNSQREQAVQSLPYLASEDFIHQRVDNITHFETTFIRKPTYYAAFSSGEQVTQQQRFGLGLLWNPVTGTLLQSQSRSEDAAWGTVMHTRTNLPWEALPMEAVYTLDGVTATPAAGAEDLDGKNLEISYSLGSTGAFAGIGEKKMTFLNDAITVDITHQGAFTEILPLVIQVGSAILIDHERGVIQLYKLGRLGYEKLRIEIANPDDVESISMLNARSLGNGMSVQPVHIITNNKLFYTLTLNPQEPLSTSTTGDVMHETPDTIKLTGIYPNPFRSFANIDFELGSPTEIKLEVFNVLGEKILSKNHGNHNRGMHTLKIDRGHLVSGLYYIRLKGKGHTQTQPVIIK
jgi:hypothetical protein